MPKLTPQQIEEAKRRGVSDEQIARFMGYQNEESPTFGQQVFSPFSKPQGVGAEILRGTIGAGGLTGLVQAPARAIQTAFKRTEQKKIDESLASLAESTDALIQSASTLPDDERKNRLMELARKNLSLINQKDPELAQRYQSFGEFGRDLVGQAIGTALTFSPYRATTFPGKVAQSGIESGLFRASTNVAEDRPAGEGVVGATVAGVALPIISRGISSLKNKIGNKTYKLGEAIQANVIKPSKADLEDGFKIANVNKYELGGSLEDSLSKTSNKIKEQSDQLWDILKSSDKKVNLSKIFLETKKQLSDKKTSSFGDIGRVNKALDGLSDEIISVGKNVKIPEAQVIKQAAGSKGAWKFGFADPDARATEIVYTKFYQNLKKEIEKVSPEEIRAINAALSELIPIQNALIRRLPIEMRKANVGLKELVAMGFALTNPGGLALLGINFLQGSGGSGKLLVKAGEKLKTKTGLAEKILTSPFVKKYISR